MAKRWKRSHRRGCPSVAPHEAAFPPVAPLGLDTWRAKQPHHRTELCWPAQNRTRNRKAMSNRSSTRPGSNFQDGALRRSRVQTRLRAQTNDLAVGDLVESEAISVGGHRWRIQCYPCGNRDEDKGQYVSLFLELVSDASEDVKIIFHVFLLGRNDEPCFSHERRSVHRYASRDPETWGWNQLLNRSVLEAFYVADGWVTSVCSIIVVDADTIAVPPSDIGRDLRFLLDCDVGTDVSFVVVGETIPAHRAVLAARSDVFKAELFGSMADATSSSITLRDIEPATFKAMLGFMYTDELPEEDDGLGNSTIEMTQHLLAAADRYALDRLKLIGARRIWGNLTVETFASTLVLAETYNCPELKSKCVDFFAVDKNLKKIIFADGFM
ncbi:BTB/POZ and MATH domain-containing protein 2 [Dichanthelium oligosanthes]|uniref:BTB/POZ and MATH domain-containing protein 2 n=1 Tax=Dichanthelium oligosanthes TaxID=888268 RepID=A0A1E5WIL3_9POAL|nr:BTB/POZ and MATH domain-containing protein 2 [Dichanthelium oligosanthes]